MPKSPQTESNKRLRNARTDSGWWEVRTWVRSKAKRDQILNEYPPPTLKDLQPAKDYEEIK